jgi:hypothetical protein
MVAIGVPRAHPGEMNWPAGSVQRAHPDVQSGHTLDPGDLPAGVLDAFHPAGAWRWTRHTLDPADPGLVADLDALEALHAVIHAGETEPRRHRRAIARRAD